MATIIELRTLAKVCLKEVQAEQYDAATYLCGYAIKLVLKISVCKTVRWGKFPETNKEFLQLTCEI